MSQQTIGKYIIRILAVHVSMSWSIDKPIVASSSCSFCQQKYSLLVVSAYEHNDLHLSTDINMIIFLCTKVDYLKLKLSVVGFWGGYCN